MGRKFFCRKYYLCIKNADCNIDNYTDTCYGHTFTCGELSHESLS